MSQAKNYDVLLKVLLIGDSGVGKPELLHKYAPPLSSVFVSTIGVDFRIKAVEVDNKRVKLQLWDTAGQERLQAITTSYYRGAGAIMLLYDVTNRESFDHVSKWFDSIRDHATDTVQCMLVGTRCHNVSDRQVSTQEGQDKAEQYGALFTEVSSEHNINVDQAFMTLVGKAVGLTVPVSFAA